jgi:hypothetical protein
LPKCTALSSLAGRTTRAGQPHVSGSLLRRELASSARISADARQPANRERRETHRDAGEHRHMDYGLPIEAHS